MERYEEYKDSGIEWIGEIPAHWQIAPLKQLFKFGKGLPITKEDLTESGLPVISYGQIHSKLNKSVVSAKDLIRYVPLTFETFASSWANYNDFIFADTSEDVDGCGSYVRVTNQDGLFAGYHTLILHAKDNSLSHYLSYLMQTDVWRSQIRKRVSGVKLFSVTKKVLGSAFVLFPDAGERERICSYLDAKTTEIDVLIEETEKSIELLEEYRKSVISEAVTKGLDPNAPMKDSGIEWISEIPEHWRISKVKYELVNHDNLRKPVEASQRSQSSDALYPYYGASGIVDYIDDYIFDDKRLLIGEDGANLVLRSLPLVYVAEGKYWVNNHAHILEPGHNLDFGYIAMQLEMIDLTEYITGSAQPKLSQSNLGIIPVVIPPKEEQTAIAKSLENQVTAIANSIEERTSLLEKLSELRKSIISEVVTGKFKVSGVV